MIEIGFDEEYFTGMALDMSGWIVSRWYQHIGILSLSKLNECKFNALATNITGNVFFPGDASHSL